MDKSLSISICLFMVVLLLCGCSKSPVSNNGTGSTTETAMVRGVLYQPDGKTPAAGVRVHIRPKKSLADTSGAGLPKRLATLAVTDSVVTDSAGRFAFDTTIDTGTYMIEAASGNNAVLIDSVALKTKAATVSLAPDTLKPAGALKGVIRLYEGGDTRKVFVLAFGIDRFAKVNADGSFKFSNLAEAKYDLRLISSIDNYGVLDMVGVPVRSADTTNLDTISLPFTGIPTPKNVKISYDTLKQIVNLTWSMADTALVKSYNVYRRNVDSNTVAVRINASPVTDTVYRDSTGVQDQTYEYMIAAANKSTTEGTKSAVVSVVIASYFVVDSTFGTIGTGQGQFNSPSDIAISANGDIYIVDEGNNRLEVFDQFMQFKIEFKGGIQVPQRIALDSLGNAYVSDQSGNIFIVDLTGKIIDSIIIGKQVISLGLGINEVYVSTYGHNNFIDDSVSAFSYGGTLKRSWWCGNSRGTSPYSLAVESPNRIWVGSYVENKVRVFDTLGGIVDSISIKPYPFCTALNKTKGRVYINCINDIGMWLKVLDRSHQIISTYRIPAMASDGPPYIALHPDGSVYEVLQSSGKILKLRSLLP